MEKALSELGHKTLYNTEHLHKWRLVEEYPLCQRGYGTLERLGNSRRQVLSSPPREAPEAIEDLCHLSDEQKLLLASQIDLMANEA